MDEAQERREQIWGVFKALHDEPALARDEGTLRAPGGWCAPSSVIYGGAGFYGPEVIIPLGQVIP